jgi:Flp pilus assembly protein TadG
MSISRPQNSFSKAAMRIKVRFLLSAFRREERGQVAVVLSLAILPMLGLVGAAVDYSRASSVRAQLQGAMDAAVLAGAKDGSSKWQTTALATFNANTPPSYVVAAKPSFSSAGTTYTGSVSATVPTALVKVMGFNSIAVSVTSVANGSPGAVDNSCIVALDHANSVSHLGMTFDGAPNVNLDKCSLRSNTSMTCNGHGSGTSASIAAGSANGCSNPKSNTAPVPDIYASLASHITRKCGASMPGFTWSAGTTPSGPAVFQSSVGNYTQYNVCGDLTLSGSGFLTGSAPSTDTVIVVENGSLNLANSSAISALRTTIVLTGGQFRAECCQLPEREGACVYALIVPLNRSGQSMAGRCIVLRPGPDEWCR